MKENDVVLKTVTKIVVFILLTFGFYIYLAGHNNQITRMRINRNPYNNTN